MGRVQGAARVSAGAAIAVGIVLLALAAAGARGQAVPGERVTEKTSEELSADLLKASQFRAIGPAATGGRIVDLAVHPERPFVLWAASASGGLWKSVNNGTTWSCAFDRSLSIGDIAVCDGDPDVLWLGTGEGNNQRSSYAGNGVWRTLDGGTTWEHLGLEETHHIGRIVVDPDDRDVAWVAALGHLYTRNDERGLYKTEDGGESWECVLHLGDAVGVADVIMDPRNADVLYAASYERLRRAWNFDDVGRSAIYKTTNGGLSWRKLAGGLPNGKLGRIGISLFDGDPDVVYACIDNQNLRPAPAKTPEAKAPDAKEPPAKEPAAKDAPPEPPVPIGGEIWRSSDGGRTWEKRNDKPVSGEPPYYYGQIRVDPVNPERVWLLGIIVFVSDDGGKSWTEGEVAGSLHSDHHALWIDPHHRGRVVLGNDGGLAQSFDDGRSWDHYDNLSIAQFYTVSTDNRRPYRIYGGLQDNGVWMGPSRSRNPGGAATREWSFIGGGDGMYVLADPEDPDVVYLESQFGALQRSDLRTWQSAWIQPPPLDPPSGTGEKIRNRFNWCSPLLISAHNSRVVYFGSQFLWKSLDRGDRWKAVSPDLTTNDAKKIAGNVPHCTLTTISESPLDPDLLLVGTDDGNVQWTEDGGHSWENVTDRFPGLPGRRWVSRVELSRHDKRTAWVTFTGYREDDFAPYAYRTRDGGESFELVTEGLPDGPVNVVHESPRAKGVLFLGSDAGGFFSLDGGDRWQALASGLPTVSVLDLAVHPREREVVLGTHGRGFFVVDVAPHEQLAHLDAKVLGAAGHVFTPAEATAWRIVRGLSDGSGDRRYRAPNPDSGAAIWYWLKDDVAAAPKLEILDVKGKLVRTLEAATKSGLHRIVWDLQPDPPKEREREGAAKPAAPEKPAAPTKRRFESATSPGELLDAEDEESLGSGALGANSPQDAPPPPRRRFRGGAAASPGSYTVRLTLGKEQFEQPLTLRADPLDGESGER